MPAEFDFVDWILARQRAAGVPLVGDDLATLNAAGEQTFAIGADQLLEGVHFDLATADLFDVGRKAMNRNLSDCAALAALPAAAVVTLALPRGFGIEKAQRLYEGLEAAGAAFDCPIVGGDTGSWSGPLAISVAIIGRMAGVAPVTRAGARPGDGIFVTGPLGGSIIGRHLTFSPRVREARALVARHVITSMIDLSDGLSRDLAHVCQLGNVGARLDAEHIPIHADVARLSASDWTALDHALHDGEDYELLFSSPAATIDGALRIGVITTTHGINIKTDAGVLPLPHRGWQHAL